ncbi:MAG: hypothetical protein NTW32_08160 [Chloroflexi bacterium]|nr:hypothetical protein [Chloroflexota bacterium]
MRQGRIVSTLSILVLAMLACNAVSGIRVAQTEFPAMLTAAPTVLGPLGTAAAEFTPPAISTQASGDSGVGTAGGLGIALDDVKTILATTQQFTFTDASVDGQPAAIASLSSNVAASLPVLGDGFSAAFIGDPKNLNEIKVTIPFSDDQTSVEAGLSLVTVIFASIMPSDVLISFIPWVTQNYSKIPVGGSEEFSVKNIKFKLSRTQTTMLLDLVSVK